MDILKSKKAIIVAIIVAVLGWAGYTVTEQDVRPYVDMVMTESQTDATPEAQNQSETPEKPADTITENFRQASAISEKRRVHILYGDASGGGHLHGTGKPCKSEFPEHWSEDTIIKEVELIAANDNLGWEQQRNGYHVAEQTVGTVKVRVVKDRDNRNVITAYPINVPRNPCPANDN